MHIFTEKKNNIDGLIANRHGLKAHRVVKKKLWHWRRKCTVFIFKASDHFF